MSGSVPALNLTNAERQAFAHLYAMADPRYTGMISGDAAVKFFEGFQLPTLTLGQIWSIADSGNNGFLTPQTFGVALRLIAHAQRGEGVNEAGSHKQCSHQRRGKTENIGVENHEERIHQVEGEIVAHIAKRVANHVANIEIASIHRLSLLAFRCDGRH